MNDTAPSPVLARPRAVAVALVVATILVSVFLFGAVEPRVLEPALLVFTLIGVAALAPALWSGAPLPRDPVLLAATALVALAATTSPWSVEPSRTLEWIVRLVGYLAIYGVFAHLTPSRRVARLALFTLIAMAFATALYGLAVTLSGREVVLWLSKADYRDSVTGTFINRNHFACYLVLHLYAAIGLFAQVGARARRVLLAPLAIALLALALTLSRGGLLAAVGALPVLLWLLPPSPRRRLRLLSLAAAIAFAALIATNWHRLQLRLEASFDPGGEPSAAARLSMWRSALRAFAERPWIGYGAGTFESLYPRFREVGLSRKVTYAHQEYLEQLAEMGLAGALLTAAVLVLLARGFNRALAAAGPDRPIVAGIAAGVTAVALHAAVDFPLKIPAVSMSLAALVGIAFALGRDPARLRIGTVATRLVAGLATLALVAAGARSVQVGVADRHLRRADRLFERPDWDGAGREYRRATEVDPLEARGWAGLAYTEMNRAKFRSPERDQLIAAAFDHLDQAERRDPLDADHELQRAWLLNFLGRRDQAAAAYDRAIADDPANANVLFHAATFHLHRHEIDRGIELVTRAIRAWPRWFGGKLKEIDQAVDDPDRLLAAIPDDLPFLKFQYAMYLLDHRKDVVAARRAFQEAIQGADWRPDWVILFAGELASQVSPDHALDVYASVPEDHQTAALRLEVAKLHMVNGEAAQSIAVLIEACRRFPTDPELLRFLVLFAGDRPEVREAVERYAAEAGKNLGYFIAAGHLALAAGEPDQALASYEQALELAPANTEARAAAARACRKLAEQARERGESEKASALETRADGFEARP